MNIHKKIVFSSMILLLSGGVALQGDKGFANSSEMERQPVSIQQTAFFKDVKQSFWAASQIKRLVNKGQMQMYEDGTFRPNDYVTRGEAIAVIARSLNIPLDSDFELKAKDIDPSHPYYNEIRKFAELGIIQNSEIINPEEPLRRSQIAKIIALAFDVDVDEKNHTTFNDYKEDFWAKHYIESLADIGIIKGTTATTYAPNRYVTRAQLSALVCRGEDFQRKIASYELAYDYLAKDYIHTENTKVQWINEVIKLVNEERTKAGLAPLTQDLALNQLAIIKAKDMVNRGYFDHYSPFYGHPWDQAALFDYEFTSLGENIGRNFSEPKEIVDAWMASEVHRENILRENYTHIGVGAVPDFNGNYYWVQLFSSN